MPAWIPCNGKFLEGDVIRWTEAIWPEAKGRRRKARPEKRGERRVTAEVLKPAGAGFLSLSVISDEITANKYGMPLKALKKGETLRRKPVTLTKGGAARRPWAGNDGESARALAVSRFMR
jgi:hypothetical protein